MKFTVIYRTPKRRILLKDVEASSYLNAMRDVVNSKASVDLNKPVFVVGSSGKKRRFTRRDLTEVTR